MAQLKFIFTIGMFSLMHAGYSAAQHRSFMRLTEQEFTSLPLDIILQAIFSLVVAVLGVTTGIAGEFKEIRSNVELQKKTWKHLDNRPSFYTFNHRGHIFSPASSQSAGGRSALEAQ